MNDGRRPDRLAVPLMQAFRASFRARDSTKIIEQRDEFGDRIVAGRRSSPRRAATEQALREDLSEDLAILLNTVSLASAVDLTSMPHMAKSVLNFGLADLSAKSAGSEAVERIAGELRTALKHFEPRLIAETISIERDALADMKELKVRFVIHADMHATPLDVPVDFVADIEIDSAKMKVSRV